MAKELVQEQKQIFPRNLTVQLALTSVARSKLKGQFSEAQRHCRGRKEVHENLESDAAQAGQSLLKTLAADHEESTHRVGQISPNHHATQVTGPPADEHPGFRPVPEAAAHDVAASNYNVDRFAA
jgi:hypothetical protein